MLGTLGATWGLMLGLGLAIDVFLGKKRKVGIHGVLVSWWSRLNQLRVPKLAQRAALRLGQKVRKSMGFRHGSSCVPADYLFGSRDSVSPSRGRPGAMRSLKRGSRIAAGDRGPEQPRFTAHPASRRVLQDLSQGQGLRQLLHQPHQDLPQRQRLCLQCSVGSQLEPLWQFSHSIHAEAAKLL